MWVILVIIAIVSPVSLGADDPVLTSDKVLIGALTSGDKATANGLLDPDFT